MSPAFNWAQGLATGTSHITSGVPCQDAIAVRAVTSSDGRPFIIGAVADGAGSASHAEDGASYAVETFAAFIAEALAEFADVDLKDIAERAARLVHAALSDVARHHERAPVAYAATFLGCVSDAERTAFIQIGDGAIIVRSHDAEAWKVVFRPQHGEYVNVSYFITDDDALQRIQTEVRDGPVGQIVMFSDGLEDLLIKSGSLDVHPPLFEHLRRALSGFPNEGHHEALSAQVDEVLRSEAVTSRTDDDVSILAINFEREAP